MSQEPRLGNRYKYKHHILGIFGGAVTGGLCGITIGTDQAIGGGVFAGVILGEIIGIVYTNLEE